MHGQSIITHMITHRTQCAVTQAPTNISAREAFASPVSKLKYNEDIKTTACWQTPLHDDWALHIAVDLHR